MKNYVVGILSMFDNDLKLFKVVAENECEAVKKGRVDFWNKEEAKMQEIDWHNSEDYPKDIKGICDEMPFSVIEVASFEIPTPRTELTFGQQLVGLTFNPSGDAKVQRAKELCAELADLLRKDSMGKYPSYISSLLYDHAIGEILNAQMNAVKVLTLKY